MAPVNPQSAPHERHAADAAAQRFRLSVAPDAPLFRLTTPESGAEGALTGAIVFPILDYVVRLVGFLCWRALRPPQ